MASSDSENGAVTVVDTASRSTSLAPLERRVPRLTVGHRLLRWSAVVVACLVIGSITPASAAPYGPATGPIPAQSSGSGSAGVGSGAGPEAELLVADFNGSDSVRRFALDGTAIGTFDETAGLLGAARAVEVGPDGLVYVAGADTGRVVRYDPADGSLVDVLVETDAGLVNPRGLVFDDEGRLLVASSGTDEVVSFDPDSGERLGVVAAEGLDNPGGLIVDGDGVLWVTSQNTDSIIGYSTDGGVETEIETGPGSGPVDLTVGPGGVFFVAMADAGRVDVVTLPVERPGRRDRDAVVSPFVADGLVTPTAVSIGPDGGLWVADHWTGTIGRFDATTGADLGFGPGSPDGSTGRANNTDRSVDASFGPVDLVFLAGVDETSDPGRRLDPFADRVRSFAANGPADREFSVSGRLYDAVVRSSGATVTATRAQVGLQVSGAAKTKPGRLIAASRRGDPAEPGVDDVWFDQVLPGVDLVWTADGDDLEYSFVLAPGASADLVELDFDVPVTIDADGDAILDGTGLASSAPLAYQDGPIGRVDVAVEYVVNADRTLGFEVGAYDPNLPLVIDPTFMAADADTATSTSLTLATPLGANPGDVLVAAINDGSGQTISAPAGWLTIRSDTNGTIRQTTFYRVVTASEPATHTFTTGASSSKSGAMLAYDDVDTSTPVDVHAGRTNTIGDGYLAPSVATTVDDATLVVFYGGTVTGDVTPPAGMIERAGVSVAGALTSAADEGLAGAGATGSRTATGPSSATIAHSIALRPTPGVTVNSTGDGSDSNAGNGVCDTGGTNSQGDPECTLRAAIQEANASSTVDAIRFDIPITESGYEASPVAFRIQPSTVLPNITDPVIIDAATQPEHATQGRPVIVLDGTSVSQSGDPNGLSLNAGSSTIRGLVIQNFGEDGIEIDVNGDNTIVGNYIGTDVTGTLARPNGVMDLFPVAGVSAKTDGNVIGGAAPGDRNVISGSTQFGVALRSGANNNMVMGNYIGTDAGGTVSIPNQDSGIYLDGTAGSNIIGGPGTGQGNLISGNNTSNTATTAGIYMLSSGNTVQGNRIGTDASGTAGLFNDGAGITLAGGAAGNLIGGVGAGNIIAYNKGDGVRLMSAAGSGNSILGNSIHSNEDPGLGIDLQNDAVTANDSGDGDSGTNDLLNFPVITSAVESGGTVTVTYNLDVPANADQYRVEFFANPSGADGSGNGEGETFLSATTTAPGTGLTHNFNGSAGDVIAGTATRIDTGATSGYSSTSEFSATATVTVSSDAEPRAIWRRSGVSTPFYRSWDGSTFGGQQTSASVGDFRVVQGAESPTRDEAIVVGVDSGGTIAGEIWDGSSWTALPALGSTTQTYWWSVDVAYEPVSGDAVVVYADGSALNHRVWDGATWSAEASVPEPPGGTPRQMQLAAHPWTDEMVLIVSNDSSQDYAVVWDGSTWGDGITLDSTGTGNDRTDVYVAYEQQSGRALAVWGSGDDDVHFRVWDAGWSSEFVTPGIGGDYARWITLGTDPGSDNIAMGVLTNDSDVWLSMWNGTGWVNQTTATTGTTGTTEPAVAVGFEGTSGQALATYGENVSTPRYRTWTSGSGWSGESSLPSIGATSNSMVLYPEPGTDGAMLAVNDDSSDVHYLYWNGTTWGADNEVETSSGETKNQPFLFLWNSPTPTAACSDSDGDGLCDLEEDANTDADNDPSTNPGPDTDGDTTPNYLDADDDGDGSPTALENADPNADGDPRDAVDTDRDGQPDYLDAPTVAADGTVATEQKISDTVGGLVATLDTNDRFGRSVASIGDVDGDGVVDIAVGAPFDDDGSSDRGAVYVLFLNGNGTVKAEQKISDTAGGLAAVLDNSDEFGMGVAGLGDLDGDGIPDIAVGAHQDDDGGGNLGAVHVLFLNADGTVKAEQKISHTQGGLATALDTNDRFGSSVATIGDLDGDGLNDLVVGAKDDDDTNIDSGAVYVLFLNADGTVKAEQKISNLVGGLSATLSTSNGFGIGVAGPGDVDGDGIEDVAVGAWYDDDGGTNRGAAYVLFLNTNGTVKGEQKISDTAGGFNAALDNNDVFGTSVGAVGDVDGDGVADLIVGAPSDGDGASLSGAAYVLFLNSNGTVKAEQKISNLEGNLTTTLDGSDQFGYAVAGTGDLDEDGTIGVMVGVYGDDDGGPADRGAVYTLDLAVEVPAAPVVLDNIQKGTATIGNGSSATSATITAVDPSKAFLVFNVRGNDTSPANMSISGRLSNATTLDFNRVGTSGTVTVEWSVVEFSSGVTVQRGTVTPGGSTTNVGLTAVDLAKSFPIVTMRASGSIYEGEDWARARLTSDTNLELATNNTFGNVIEWQVVEYNDAAVQSGSVSFGTGDSSRTATVTAVDPAKSWLIYNFRSVDGTTTNIGQKLVRGRVTDGTTLTFDRSSTGQTIDLEYFLVEFTDATEVQSGNANFSSSDTTQNATITAVDPARSIGVGGYAQTGGRSSYTANDNPGVGWFTSRLTASTNLQLQRDAALAGADLGWFVVHWPAPTASLGVNSTGDGSDAFPGDGDCDTGGTNSEGDPECTLRAAIEEANAYGAASVDFGIPTSDPGYSTSPLSYTFAPGSPYPMITAPIVLDATTQAGYTGDPIIELDGTGAVGASGALILRSNDSEIRGFAVHSFVDEGLEIDGSTGFGDNNTLQNNWVGLDAAGTVQGNGDVGILVTVDALNNLVGGTGANDGNVVAGSTSIGILVRTNSTGNTLLGNSVYANTGLGIDLDEDGVTPNDAGDGDSGSNDLLNFPVISSATESAGTVTVTFDLDVPANPGGYRVEFFINPGGADPSGNGEGEQFVSAATVSPGTGLTHNFSGSTGDVLTATATFIDSGAATGFGPTSEYSAAATVGVVTAVPPTTVTFRQGNNGYSGTVDTWISSNVANQDNSADPLLQIDNSPVQHGLIRFDGIIGPGANQVPVGATIVSADLTFEAADPSAADASLSLYRVLRSWVETDTWNSLSSGISTDDVEASSTPDAVHTGGLDLTNTPITVAGLEAAVQAWVDGDANQGWLLTIDRTNGWDAQSSENADTVGRPTLSVTYVVGPVTHSVNSTGDSTDASPGDAVCDTGGTNSAGDPECTLRAAIEEANAFSTDDIIDFAMPATEAGHSGGVWTITPGSALPNLSDEVTIDGSTQTGWTTTPVIELNGTSAGGSTDGLRITADNVTIRSLAINRFGADGIELVSGAANALIAGNHIGVDASGTIDRGNGARGIDLGSGSGPTTVGGATAANRNVISGNGANGIIVWNSNNNVIIGNYLGTDVTGNAPLANGSDGVTIDSGSAGNTIGQPGAGNVLSGNSNDGFENDGTGANNVVQANMIGLGADGSTPVGNGRHGIVLYNGANNTTIGGGGAGEGNVISGNGQAGVIIDGNNNPATTGNIVAGNLIGTDVTGLLDRGNGTYGIDFFAGATGNTIGGPTAADGNVVSGNGSGEAGILITGATTSANVVQHNHIGVNAGGTAAIPNNLHGVQIDGAPNTQILDNLISGNDVHGVYVYGVGTTGTQILRNSIGTNAAQTATIPNLFDGVRLEGSSGATIVGTPGNGNVIGGNADHGVNINSSDGNTIQGNYLGTDSGGSVDLGNTDAGVYSDAFNSSNNSIGGAAAGEGNVIAFNGVGIQLDSGDDNSILGNSVRSNTGLGIDLDGDGVTSNDAGDGDTGANELLNFPVILAPIDGGTTVAIELDAPAGDYRIEVFDNPTDGADASGYGEGETLIGAATVTRTGFGVERFLIPLGSAVAENDVLSATATEDLGGGSYGATSEYSATVTVGPAALTVNSTGDSTDTNPGDGYCFTGAVNSDGDPECTLRAAIEEVNALGVSNVDTDFAIPSSDAGYNATPRPHWTIGPASPLPAVTAYHDIDATTQTGWAALAPVVYVDGSASGATDLLHYDTGSDYSLLDGMGIINAPTTAVRADVDYIYLNDVVVGVGVDGTTGAGSTGDAVVFNGQFGDLRDSVISAAGGAGVRVTTAGSDFSITESYIGTETDGTGDLGNTGGGIIIDGGNNHVIGLGVRDANVIAHNSVDVQINGTADSIEVENNLIGVDLAGAGSAGSVPLEINTTGSVRVGGELSTDANTIRYGTAAGVTVTGTATASIIGNSIFSNGGLGIDLGADGVTANDPGDGDTGPNGLLNLPELTAPGDGDSSLTVSLDVPAGDYRIEVFINPTEGVDPSGYGEGETLLATKTVTHTGSGSEDFTIVVPSVSLGQVFTATATLDLGGSPTAYGPTSEFSAAVTVVPSKPVVLDSSVRRSDLTADGGLDPAAAETAGISGRAVPFDGFGDRLVGPALNIAGSAFTMTARVRPDTLGGTSTLVSKRNSGGSPIYELTVNGAGQASATFGIGGSVTVSGGSVGAGSWHDVVATWDGADAVLYVDGVEVDRAAAVGSLAADIDTPAMIGNRSDGSAGFDGLIDHVDITHDPLTGTEAGLRHANTVAGTLTVTVGQQQTGPPGPWTVTTSQSRSGTYALAAPVTPDAGSAAWAVATGIDEPGVVFESWWWINSTAGVDLSSGTRAGASATDQFDAGFIAGSDWVLRRRFGAITDTDGTGSLAPSTGSWVKVEQWTDQNGNSRLVVDGTEVITWTGQTSPPAGGSVGFRVGELPGGQFWFIDDPRARKLISPEPVVTLGPLDRD